MNIRTSIGEVLHPRSIALNNEIYDVVIVGGGHNALVCAAYLAKKGLRVVVLEQRPVLGGACVTENIADCLVSRTSYVSSLFPPKIIHDLGLHNFGLELLERDPPSFTPFSDGRYLLMYQDMAKTQAEISKFSLADADNYPKYEQALDRVVKFVEPLLFTTPPDPTKKRDWLKLAGLGWNALKLKGDLFTLTELFSSSAYDFVRKYFESDPLIPTLCTDGIIGAIGGPMSPGTAYVLLHHVMGEINGNRGRWGYVRGGMGGLSASIIIAGLRYGVDYMVNSNVEEIIVENDRAIGVYLSNRKTIKGRIVVSGADPRNTFELMLRDYDNWPDGFQRHVANIDYASATSKINLIVRGNLSFNAYDGIVPGTFHICEDCAYMERAADVAKHGGIPDDLVIEGCIPSVVDNSLTPEGVHIISLLVQYTPYKLAEGNWEDRRIELLDKAMKKLCQYTNLDELELVHADVITPVDLASQFRLTGGNLFHGVMNLSQLLSFRPVPGYANYRTPIQGLYMCGSATHPGGGVTGIPGHNAAREILRDKLWRSASF